MSRPKQTVWIRIQQLVDSKISAVHVELNSKVSQLEKAERDNQLLRAKLSRLEISHTRLRNEVRGVKQHSMKNNLIFNFDYSKSVGKETRGEDAAAVVRHFLISEMKVANANRFYIPVAHRLGGKRNGHRTIIAKFPVASELDTILRHGKQLQGTKHSVSRQTPPSMTERNKFAMNKFKDMKKDVNNQARLSKGVLSIKGKVQTQFLEPSVPESDMPAEIDQPKVAESDTIDDSGSHFKGLATNVGDVQELSTALNTVLTRPGVGVSSHVIYTYRYSDGDDDAVENFHSDDDHGMGLDLLVKLREMDKKQYSMCSDKAL